MMTMTLRKSWAVVVRGLRRLGTWLWLAARRIQRWIKRQVRAVLRWWAITVSRAYAGMTKEERLRAVAHARSPGRLDEMWSVWESEGQSREGLLYVAVLERRSALGSTPSAAETALIQRVHAARDRGRTLPPIRGRIKL